MAKGEEKWCAKTMQVTFVLEVLVACLVCITFVEANIGAWRKIHYLFNFHNLGHLCYILKKICCPLCPSHVLCFLSSIFKVTPNMDDKFNLCWIYWKIWWNQSPITFCSMTNNCWLRVVNIHHNIKKNTLFPYGTNWQNDDN